MFSGIQENLGYSKFIEIRFLFPYKKSMEVEWQSLCSVSRMSSMSQALVIFASACGFCSHAYHLMVTRWLLHIRPLMHVPGQKKKKEIARGIWCCLYEARKCFLKPPGNLPVHHIHPELCFTITPNLEEHWEILVFSREHCYSGQN